ncbi:hypothetical protein [Celeribacter indicus]|uniref:Lipoprotein n=1 Tax=Celeribacter indicus TaxID=1208324 RepID=A0A0B5E6D1_9RHOB|nr:hypothetical protein [Celeribacter indicus]AJE48571.1 hypothetical protein P73_3856 [Celeribacter indicus]SDX08710.1 hypothetical protein SAMN05443573_11362 [Celeribacter indicus]
MRALFSLLSLALPLALPLPLAAQDWPNLDPALFSDLAGKPEHVEASFFLPNHADPAQATEALGVVYEWIEGSAGSTSIAVGHFSVMQEPVSLAYLGPVSGVFGHQPRDTAFFPERIELTMTTLKDDDPRCCPSGETRYSVDRSTREAEVLWSR